MQAGPQRVRKLVFEPIGCTLSHLGGYAVRRAFRLIAALCRLSPFCLRRGPFHRGKGPKARRAAARTRETPAAVRDKHPAKLVTRCVAPHLHQDSTALGRAHARNAPGRTRRQKPQKMCIMPPDGAQRGKPHADFRGWWYFFEKLEARPANAGRALVCPGAYAPGIFMQFRLSPGEAGRPPAYA